MKPQRLNMIGLETLIGVGIFQRARIVVVLFQMIGLILTVQIPIQAGTHVKPPTHLQIATTVHVTIGLIIVDMIKATVPMMDKVIGLIIAHIGMLPEILGLTAHTVTMGEIKGLPVLIMTTEILGLTVHTAMIQDRTIGLTVRTPGEIPRHLDQGTDLPRLIGNR